MGGSWKLLRAVAAHGVRAHEVQPAVMDVTAADPVVIAVTLNAEAILASIDLSASSDTDESPQARDYEALRALEPEGLARLFEETFVEFVDGHQLDGLGAPRLVSVSVVPEPDGAQPRDTQVTMEAPRRSDAPRLGRAPRCGEVILRHRGAGDDAFAALLGGGGLSPPLRGEGEGVAETFARYVASGFEQIVPKGLDHILFVLGLFFLSLSIGPLLWQVTAFTVAQTTTLMLATLGMVSIPASVVEPLSALSIVYVGIEDVLRPALDWWRPAVVSGFGLLHGLGFASVLSDVGGSAGHFLARLAGFNIGVELGRLAVVAVAFVLLGLPFGRKLWWRTAIATPASLAIAAVGAWWALEPTVLA